MGGRSVTPLTLFVDYAVQITIRQSLVIRGIDFFDPSNVGSRLAKTDLVRTSAFFFCLAFFFSVFPVFAGESPAISRELHWAVTDEKFELAMERLYRGEKADNRWPVVLCHGLFLNSAFLNLDEEHSFARYLAQEGFDVWNLSLRGTGRSLNPLGWGSRRWTLDDIIEKDLSAVIRYVQKESRKSRVPWVGHGMGGMLLYGYLAKRGGAGLSAGVAIGAPLTFGHPQQEPIKKLLKLKESEFLKKAFLYLNAPLLGRLLLPLVPAIEKVFYNPDNMDDELKAKLLEVALADIKPGVLDHLLRIIAEGEFVSATGNFNYRRNLSKARIPVLLLGGEKDVIAPPAALKDVERALNSAERKVSILGPGLKDPAAYGHFDLILGKKAKKEIFPAIVRWLRQKSGQD